ncbi:hypothetical protein [Mesorhizobium sp.]|uniref:hypothetical protein n=1 Tax=Mesorhizobium sp. TaxID=1871066 RepID=UPI000FE97DF0|nr:hypothetical protein [Mesorhizobium sp.]RWO22813.1 MAG: hypothetical protein EOS09_19275 [Mesorhizobium sp.]
MTEIEHDPNEPPRDTTGTWIYWASAAGLVLLWAGYLLFNAPDWWALAIGASTGLFIATWAIELTGNKVPKWMR